MKRIVYIIILVLLCSCEESGVQMGTVKYYPSFLWVDACTIPVEKTYHFDFSPDAKNDGHCFAEFQFVDNDEKPIDTNTMRVMSGDEWLAENKLKVTSGVDSISLRFIFTPQAEGGQHQGYFRLVNYNLDRLDSQPLDGTQHVDAFQWTLQYEKCMNPLGKVLLWITLLIVACLMIWFLIIRPSLYPHFGKFTKSILIKQNDVIVGQFNYAFKGARKVIFYDRKVKQSLWSFIFIGEIKTYVNPLFRTKLTFSPRRNNAAAFGTGYSVNPNPIHRSGVATIINTQERLTITLR